MGKRDNATNIPKATEGQVKEVSQGIQHRQHKHASRALRTLGSSLGKEDTKAALTNQKSISTGNSVVNPGPQKGHHRAIKRQSKGKHTEVSRQ